MNMKTSSWTPYLSRENICKGWIERYKALPGITRHLSLFVLTHQSDKTRDRGLHLSSLVRFQAKTNTSFATLFEENRITSIVYCSSDESQGIFCIIFAEIERKTFASLYAVEAIAEVLWVSLLVRLPFFLSHIVFTVLWSFFSVHMQLI